MELRYMGFDQERNTRTYKFDRVAKGEQSVRVLIKTDISLFLKHHIGIQEGPVLCARKLTTDLEAQPQTFHELTNDDLTAFAVARAEEELRKKARRSNLPLRS